MLRTLAAASVATLMAAAPVWAQEASISVDDQKVKGKQVTVEKVVIPVDGWVVIHPSDAKGHFIEKDIGHAPVKAGSNSNISVTLTEDVKDGASFTPCCTRTPAPRAPTSSARWPRQTGRS